jgi:PTH2 family peptidyl-tRNA hydrolase
MHDVKQVIVVRKDLKMRKGKLAAQVAHASMKVILDKTLKMKNELSKVHEWWLRFEYESPLSEWLNGSFTKVVVYVESEKELFDIKNECHYNDIPWAVVIDSGKTEFHGEPTLTCLAVGPDWSDKIDEITGDLPLL